MSQEKTHDSKKTKHPFVGQSVWFWRQQAQQTGPDSILTEHAVVTGMAAKASNFQAKDMAVNLRILPDAGGSGELQRQGIMFSPMKKPGCWGWNTDLEFYIAQTALNA